MNKLQGIKFGCISVGAIPTSYKEALTYEEQLLWLCNYINETVVPTVNEYIEKVDKIDINFEKINNAIRNMQNEIDNINEDLINYYNRITTETENKLINYNNQIISIMNDYQNIFNNSLRNLREDLEAQIEAIEIGNINVYDPTTGYTSNINEVLSNIYDSLRNNAISVAEFEALNLTCTQFESYDMTAYNFDINAKSILL